MYGVYLSIIVCRFLSVFVIAPSVFFGMYCSFFVFMVFSLSVCLSVGRYWFCFVWLSFCCIVCPFISVFLIGWRMSFLCVYVRVSFLFMFSVCIFWFMCYVVVLYVFGVVSLLLSLCLYVLSVRMSSCSVLCDCFPLLFLCYLGLFCSCPLCRALFLVRCVCMCFFLFFVMYLFIYWLYWFSYARCVFGVLAVSFNVVFSWVDVIVCLLLCLPFFVFHSFFFIFHFSMLWFMCFVVWCINYVFVLFLIFCVRSFFLCCVVVCIGFSLYWV